MFSTWSELQSDNMDEAYRDSLIKVMFEGVALEAEESA
jgi:hypothetical protein